MGLIQNGEWVDKWYDTQSTGGEFKRQESHYRYWITAEGGHGPVGQKAFPAETGRYHLFVSLACPWAHRALMFRKLKDLEAHIGVTAIADERAGPYRDCQRPE